MDSSAEALAAVGHELEVADAIRREILNECTEISELSETRTSLLSKMKRREEEEAEEEEVYSKTLAASAKTTPRLMPMSEIMYKLKKTDFIVPSS